MRMKAPSPQELAERQERLLADLAKLTHGWVPSAADLADAPLLEDWEFAQMWVPGSEQQTCLAGRVTGHPKLGDGWIWTTPVVFIDRRAWVARTLSRFYRLGKRREKRTDVESNG